MQKKFLKKKIILIGCGTHTNQIIDVINESSDSDFYGFVSYGRKKIRKQRKYLGNISAFKKKELLNYFFFIGVGDNNLRYLIFKKLSSKIFKWATLVSKYAIVSNTARIGSGTIVMPGVVINAHTKIGKQSIINTSSTIDHNCSIGNFANIGPGVIVAGNVNIGNKTLIGIGSKIINNIKIKDEIVIGSSSFVNKSILSKGIYVGIPVKKV